ncbi:uncharacterized protein [Onthophagus taurus]|uniref:uncharacterized protein n=1 Tax=Onthophagus taurus TaxID=166361 RepID=UPI000C201C98|nr:uncharacterized protein LOC111413642 [Onthophagus taurus]
MWECNSDISTSEDPLELESVADLTSTNSLIPKGSKSNYERVYRQFKAWFNQKNAKFISEDVLLGYLMEKSKTVKSTSLWTIYSILKRMLMIKEELDVTKYFRVGQFLRKMLKNKKSNRSNIFTQEQINMFLEDAQDEKYLLFKVILIIGVSGGLKRHELTNMTLCDVEDRPDELFVNIFDPKTEEKKSFTITNPDYLRIYRKYINLRPKHVKNSRLFLKYQPGKCYCQAVGLETMGKIPSLIATYLKLPNSNEYSGFCFKMTNTALIVKRS